MSEHPILFSAEMVRAILEGRKTQTRRIIKTSVQENFFWGTCWDYCRTDKENNPAFCAAFENETVDFIKCPYQADTLWVRETWVVPNSEGCKPRDITPTNNVLYKATDDYPWWQPSIFMPRWASRITLLLKSVTVEQVQDITEKSAIAEGTTGREDFRRLWDEINLKRGYGWDGNPYVWVLDFEVKR